MEVMDICYSYPECIDIFKQALLSILPYYQRRIQNESHHRNSYKIALVGDYNADVTFTPQIFNFTVNCFFITYYNFSYQAASMFMMKKIKLGP